MANYLASLLTSNEHILFETRLSWILYISYLFVAAILTICIIFFASSAHMPFWQSFLASLACMAICLCYPLLVRHNTEFAITNRRVLMKSGIISRNVFEMRLMKIESVDLEQSIPGRILNYGTLVVHGTGDTAKKFSMIESPLKFRKILDEAAEQLKYGHMS